MIVVVTGLPRSGTSAMMGALAAGGVPVVSNPTRAHRLRRFDDDEYQANGPDVYESTPRERALPSWPRQHDGHAVKVVTPWLSSLAVHDYLVIVMRRDLEEVRQSWEAAFREKVSPRLLASGIEEGVRTLDNRRDVRRRLTIHYRDMLLADPQATFSSLSLDELPFDPKAAAATIDPARCRFRREDLVKGATA